MAPEPMKIPECRADSADTEVAKREFQIALEEFEKGNYKLAAEGFTRAYVRSCSAPVLYNLGMTYEKLGDSSGALEAYDLYLKKQTNNAHVDEVKQRIEALRGKTR
jgi:tetratricopeptide (TPR) repeat protein